MADRLTVAPSLALINRHWRIFAFVGIAAILLSAILSGPWLLKPRFRSQAVVYPVNLNSYSVETRADQLLQLLESNSTRDSIIARFRLVEHYALDTAAVGGRGALYNMYRERVKVDKTRYESVDIRVTDEDPVQARDMVLAILHQTDLLARRLQRENSHELLAIVRQGIARTGAKLDSVAQRLDALRREQGLLDYGTQTKELTKGYMLSLAGGGRGQGQIEGLLEALEEDGGEFHRLSVLNDRLIGEYAGKLAEERQALQDVNKELTYTNVVVYPEVSDKKVYPVRWLIVLAATATALLLCYILLFLRAQARWTNPAEAKG